MYPQTPLFGVFQVYPILGCNYSLSSINTTWGLSRKHWWGLIIIKSIEVIESLVEYLSLKYLVQIESWAIVFSISSLINFGIVYIWPIYESLDKKIWLTIIFFFLNSVWNIDFFRWGTHLYMSLFPSVRPSIVHHISGTVHHLIIIFGAHV